MEINKNNSKTKKETGINKSKNFIQKKAIIEQLKNELNIKEKKLEEEKAKLDKELYDAVEKNNYEKVKEYLREGANIEVKIRGTGFCEGCHDKTRGCPYIPLTFERGVEFSNRMFVALDLITRAKINKPIDHKAIPIGLAKTHAFRLGPIMKVSGLTNRIMANDNTINPNQITSNIATFIIDDVRQAEEKIEELLKQGNEIYCGKRKEIEPNIVRWFESGRWIHVYNGFMGMINEMG